MLALVLMNLGSAPAWGLGTIQTDLRVGLSADDTNIEITSCVDLSDFTESFVELEYTKD